MSADVTFFEYVPYFSPPIIGTASAFVSLSLFMPYLHLLLGILRQCHLETLRSHMHQHRYGSQLRISELYILIAKKFLPLNQFRSTSPVDGPPIQPSAPPFDLDAPIAFRKGKRYCTVHPISNFVSYDHLNAVSILVF